MGDISDIPIRNPDDDLLGAKEHAQKLADYIWNNEPPFTIGLYGEWGSGKTSVIELLRYFLEGDRPPDAEPVCFIPFTAWPYKTADELWRALILKIAQRLYGAPDGPLALPVAEATQVRPVNPTQRLRAFLATDAWVFREPPRPPDPFAEYRTLVARLDSTLYGGIGKDSELRTQINQEEVITAAAKAVTAALGSFSPLVAGLRNLLGLGEPIKFSSLLQKDKNEATRDRIQSIGEFQRALVELFEKKAANKRVCVFIDDLDRSMPDVALDLLEAIKALLEGVRCVFIVAADQQLIGQGLKARFRDLLASGDREQVEAFYNKKGREYFEKIIQLGVPVPEPTPEQAHRFISAHFPQWMPVSDLVEAAIGTNPRRLKQYCSLLNYRFRVAQKQRQQPLENGLSVLRDRIVSIRSRDPRGLALVVELAEGEPEYAALMRGIEDCLAESQPDQALADVGERVTNPTARKLYDVVVESGPLLRIFQTPPQLSDSPPSLVAAFGHFADIRPDPTAILATEDRPFMRILEPVVRRLSVSTEKLLRDDFERMVAFNDRFGDMMGQLALLAASREWPLELLRVERHLEDPASAGDPATLAEPARKLLKFIQEFADRNDAAGPRAMLLGTPRFSSMLREEVAAFWDLRDNLPMIEEVLSKEIYQSAASPGERHRALAAKAADLVPEGTRTLILQCLDARIRTAREYLDLRSFAKIDALQFRWPALSDFLRYDRSVMLNLEAEILGATQPESALAVSPLEEYRQDRRFRRFISLRPLLKDIYPGEIQTVLKAASAAPQVAAPVPGPPAPEPPPPTVILKELTGAHDTVLVTIAADGPSHKVVVHPGKGEPFEYVATLPVTQIHELVQRMRFGREFAAPMRAMREETRARGAVPEVIRDVGETLFTVLFPGNAREQVIKILRTPRTLRFLFEVSDPQLAFFPWETLYVEELLAFPALTNCWIERLVRSEVPRPAVGFESPLRILAVLANPADTAPLDVDGEREMLTRALAPALNAGVVRLQVVGPDASTLQNVLQQIRSFRPHVFHFVGHGLYNENVGTIVLGSREKGVIVPANDVITMLDGYGVVLAVLNACDTGTSLRNDAVTSLAGTLVKRGLPAVVATMREVADETGLMFTRDFYTAIVAGEPVETAVTESRKALSIEKWDWSVYALFTSLTKLDKLRLPTPTRRAE
jgi:hypothetical protein